MLQNHIGLTALIQLGGSWAKKNPRHAKKSVPMFFVFQKRLQAKSLGVFLKTKNPQLSLRVFLCGE